MADNAKIREEVQALTTQLEAGIQDLYSSEKYAAYLKTLATFHKYSLRNTMLIYMQMPEATNVAGFNKWQNSFKRHVEKGQKGIRILAPAPYVIKKEMEKLDPDTNVPLFDNDGKPITEEVNVTIPMFRPVSVFDVSQTYGEPLPSLAENLTGDVAQYEAFLNVLEESAAFPVAFAELEEDLDGFCNYDNHTITIRNGMSEVQTIAAVVHEMTHADLHDYNHDLDEQESVETDAIPDSDSDDNARQPSRRAKEVEAESVAYVVCQHYGIDTGANSFGYIAEWSKNQELPELKASLEIIRKTSAAMIDRIDVRFAEICKARGIDLTPEQEAPEKEVAPENPAADKAETPAPEKPKRKLFITPRQREQAERMAEKWQARVEAYYAGGDGWGADTVGYIKTNEEADKAIEIAAKIRTSIDNLSSGNGEWRDVQTVRKAVADRDALDVQATANKDAPITPETEPATHILPQAEEQPFVLEPHKPDAMALPDPSIDIAERDLYGYSAQEMYPLRLDRALELYEQDLAVYLLHADGTESMVFDREEIENHQGIFGIEADIWEHEQAIENQKSAARESEVSSAAALPDVNAATYEIYQIKEGEGTRQYRFESLEHLDANGLSVEPDNYNLTYTAPLNANETLNSIYEKFNTAHPDDFTGHSLSVSDIVILRQNGEPTAHYVDPIGFKTLPDFFNGKEQTEKPQPSIIDEQEAHSKTDQSVSPIDLSNALKNERLKDDSAFRPQGAASKQRPSVLAQIQEAKKVASQDKEQPKNTPKHSTEREI